MGTGRGRLQVSAGVAEDFWPWRRDSGAATGDPPSLFPAPALAGRRG
jgi:hypothetical protein